jgi:alpha-methylacyl-CoA racemase
MTAQEAHCGKKAGPLAGLTMIEMAGLGPAPFAALMLAEMGARVVRVERIGEAPLLPLPPELDLDRHGREILRLDLKKPDGVALLLTLTGKVDVLIEGFRPGVMERLGLGPVEALAANPALIYARMTGFGQDGPLSGRAGHDLTYLAWSGVLSAIGEKGRKPVPPLNLIADYGGGAMFLVAGVLAALIARQRSGRGEVVDAAMVDGAAMLAAPVRAMLAAGLWREGRGKNLLDGGAPFYDTYETADGGYVAVACLEPKFFAEFARLLPLDPRYAALQHDRRAWEEMRAAIAVRFLSKPRSDWQEIFAGSDACVAPVLSLAEAAANSERDAGIGSFERPAPAPRFSHSRTQPAAAPDGAALDPARILAGFGIGEAELERLAANGALAR